MKFQLTEAQTSGLAHSQPHKFPPQKIQCVRPSRDILASTQPSFISEEYYLFAEKILKTSYVLSKR